MRPSAAPPKGRQLQYELGESINAEPIGADNYVRRGAEFVVAVRADAGPGYFFARRYKRLRRWRNRAPLRDRDGFWQIDGPAGGQSHGRGGFYFAGTAEGRSSLCAATRAASAGNRAGGAFVCPRGPESHFLRRFFTKATPGVTGPFVATYPRAMPLIGETVGTAGSVDRGEQSHVLGKLHA